MNIKDLIPWDRDDKNWSDNPFAMMERDMKPDVSRYVEKTSWMRRYARDGWAVMD